MKNKTSLVLAGLLNASLLSSGLLIADEAQSAQNAHGSAQNAF